MKKDNPMSKVKLLPKIQRSGWRVKLFLLCTSLVLLPLGLLFAQPSSDPIVRLNSEMHTNTISSIDSDAEGNFILTTSQDRTAKLWDAKSSQLLKTLRVPINTTSAYGILYDGALSPDGNLAVIAGRTGDITTQLSIFYLYDTQNGELLGYEPTPSDKAINNLEFSPDGRYLMVSLFGDNPKIVIYKTDYTMGNVKMEQFKILEGYGNRIMDVEFDNTGNLATASLGGYIQLYDSNFNMIRKFKGSGEKPSDLAFSPDGEKMAVSFFDKSMIEVFDTGSFKVLYRPDLDEVREGTAIKFLTFSEDGRYLFGGGFHRKRINKKLWFTIRRWEKGGRGKYIDIPVGRTSQINNFLTARGDGIIFTTGDPGLGRMQPSGKIEYHRKYSKFIFNAGGIDLRTNFAGDKISFNQHENYVFSMPTGQLRKSKSSFPKSTDQRNGLHISDWEGNSTARINGRTVELNGSGIGVDVAPDGESAIIVTWNGIQWFDANGIELWSIHTDSPPTHGKITGNGKYVVTTHWDGTVRWYDVEPNLEYVITGVLGGSFADKSGIKAGDVILELDSKKFNSTRKLSEYVKPRKEIRFKLIREGRIIMIDAFKSGEQFGFRFQPKDRLMATLYINPEDHRWIIFTPSGHFDASPGGEDLAGWHINRGIDNEPKFYPLSQYFDEFYTPSLGERLLRGEEFKSEVAEMALPPAVEIVSPGNGINTDRQSVTVQVKVTDQGGGIDEIRLYHNEKLVETTQRGLKVSGTTGSQTRTYDVAMMPGENHIQATAFNDQRIESNPAGVTVNYAGGVASSDLYVLAVGVNEYKNTTLNLNYGRPDAEAFTEAIERQSGDIFQSVNVTTLYDGQATRAGLQSSFEDIITSARPQDTFLFFYAGHGVMSEPEGDRQGDFYMALSDVVQLYGNNTGLQAEGISGAEMTELSRRIPARKQVIVLDACQSGGAVQTFAMRGAAEQKAIMQLARSAGLVVLASTGTEQYATEFQALGHGVFTYALLNGLNGKADGGSRDGKITVKELEAFINDRVPALTTKHRGQAQYPNSYARGQDFPLVVVQD